MCRGRPTLRFTHRQRGAVAALAAIGMAALLAMAALALDMGHLILNKNRLQNSVDAAALSGAKTLSLTATSDPQRGLQARQDAWQTFQLNAQAPGNAELLDIWNARQPSEWINVELASSVYGPFSFPGPQDARYVRISVADYPLQGFFYPILAWFRGSPLPGKTVAALAVAGPSPTTPCNLAPLMVCGDPNAHDPANGQVFGYQFGGLEVLKGAAGNDPVIGPGNFQLIRLDPNQQGGADVRQALAGGVDQCIQNNQIDTEPGNTVGPVSQGLNTRFGQYNGPLAGSAGQYPPDLLIDNNQSQMRWDDNNQRVYVRRGGQNLTVRNDNQGNLYIDDGQRDSSDELFDYLDWEPNALQCDSSGSNTGGYSCQSNGVWERRVLSIAIGNCNGASGGQTQVPLLGYGCFFLLQPLPNGQGNQAQIFGQFIDSCQGDAYPGPTPQNDQGPQIIQLYKSYLDNQRTPSHDS